MILKFRIAAVLAVRIPIATVAAAFGARAQNDEKTDISGAPWALSLMAQLRDEKRCDVQATYFVREMPVADGTGYAGRVRCGDGREFDFSQAKPHLKFELKACENSVC